MPPDDRSGGITAVSPHADWLFGTQTVPWANNRYERLFEFYLLLLKQRPRPSSTGRTVEASHQPPLARDCTLLPQVHADVFANVTLIT